MSLTLALKKSILPEALNNTLFAHGNALYNVELMKLVPSDPIILCVGSALVNSSVISLEIVEGVLYPEGTLKSTFCKILL